MGQMESGIIGTSEVTMIEVDVVQQIRTLRRLGCVALRSPPRSALHSARHEVTPSAILCMLRGPVSFRSERAPGGGTPERLRADLGSGRASVAMTTRLSLATVPPSYSPRTSVAPPFHVCMCCRSVRKVIAGSRSTGPPPRITFRHSRPSRSLRCWPCSTCC